MKNYAKNCIKNCLVVDDGPFDREVLRHCAADLGFNVIEATSVEEALASCRARLPDCILLDWEMPGPKGITLVQAVRSLLNGEKVCILMCSSNSHGSFIGRAYVQGADGYLVKPVTRFSLEAKLQEAGALS